MKIGIISSYGVYCGIARYTRALVSQYLKEGHRVVIFAKEKEKGETIDRGFQEKPRVKVIRCWSADPKELCGQLLESVKKENLDILHIQDIFRRSEAFEELYKSLPHRIVLTLHSVNSPHDLEFIKAIKNFVTHFIVHNDLSRTSLFYFSKILKKRVDVIHHGTYSCKKLKKEKAREILGLRQNTILILSYGFFSPGKGSLEIIESLPEVIKLFPNLLYIHLGRSRLKEKLSKSQYFLKCKRAINKLESKGKARIIWKFVSEEEAQFYFEASDLIILFYKCSYPILHSSGACHQILSSGRPIICSDIFAFSELSKEVVYKVPYQQEELEKAIIKILGDKKLQKRLVENSLKYSKLTSWENTAKKHLKVFQKTLKQISSI